MFWLLTEKTAPQTDLIIDGKKQIPRLTRNDDDH